MPKAHKRERRRANSISRSEAEKIVFVLAESGNCELLQEALQSHTVFTQVLTADNNRAFHWALANGHEDMVNLLLSNKAVRHEVRKSNQALHVAVTHNRRALFDRLLLLEGMRDRIGANDNEILRTADKLGHKEFFVYLSNFPSVQRARAPWGYKEMLESINRGQTGRLSRLLTIPAIKAKASSKKNALFKRTVELANYIGRERSVVCALMLLEISEVCDKLTSKDLPLVYGAGFHYEPLFKAMISLPSVRKSFRHEVFTPDRLFKYAHTFKYLFVEDGVKQFFLLRPDVFNNILQKPEVYLHYFPCQIVFEILVFFKINGILPSENHALLKFSLEYFTNEKEFDFVQSLLEIFPSAELWMNVYAPIEHEVLSDILDRLGSYKKKGSSIEDRPVRDTALSRSLDPKFLGSKYRVKLKSRCERAIQLLLREKIVIVLQNLTLEHSNPPALTDPVAPLTYLRQLSNKEDCKKGERKEIRLPMSETLSDKDMAKSVFAKRAQGR